MFKRIITATAAVAVVTMFAGVVSAQQSYGNNLFGQYSTYGANQVNASMYPAPHPVPAYVGGSMYTYEPLMPHEMMYTHQRNYYNYYGNPGQYYQDPYGARAHQGGGSLNVTKVRWQNGSYGYAPLPFSSTLGAGLHYKWAQKWYCIGKGCNGRSLGGQFRGNLGGVGCASGNCGSTQAAPSAGCTGCSSNLSDTHVHANN